MSPTLNPTGYCYHCKQQVLLKREDIDICLVLILAIFTAGIGLIVYLSYYYKKEEVHCVHCGATCSQTFDRSESQIAPQVSKKPQARLFQEQEAVKEEKVDINFCPFCGAEFNQAGVKFCPNCGSKI